MAVFHMDIKAHSRSLNVHAIALSSYRSGERLHCDADGRIRNCRSGIKSAVEFTALVNNRDLSRERLWNKVEEMERRKDAVVAREMELGLPCELNIEQQKELALSMAEKIAERYNCAVDLALHAPDSEGDQRNWHVHLLFSPRPWTDTDKRNKEFSTKKYRDLNKANAKQEVLYWRQLWEEKFNQALEQAGEEERVSSLSCEARGEIKKYEHFDFNKYQLLRRSGELEDAKRASRLALEISRDELELEDLIDIKNELIKEKEQLIKKKENTNVRKELSIGGSIEGSRNELEILGGRVGKEREASSETGSFGEVDSGGLRRMLRAEQNDAHGSSEIENKYTDLEQEFEGSHTWFIQQGIGGVDEDIERGSGYLGWKYAGNDEKVGRSQRNSEQSHSTSEKDERGAGAALKRIGSWIKFTLMSVKELMEKFVPKRFRKAKAVVVEPEQLVDLELSGISPLKKSKIQELRDEPRLSLAEMSRRDEMERTQSRGIRF